MTAAGRPSRALVGSVARLVCKVRLHRAVSRSTGRSSTVLDRRRSWMLVVVGGDISIARRYEDEMTHGEAERGALKVARAW